MQYKTKQKELILNLLKEHQDCCFSAKQINEFLNQQISKATLYRILDHLFESQFINRFYNAHTNAYEYQYLFHQSCQTHLHLKCNHCGKVYHLKQNINQPSFLIDYSHSLIVGTCIACHHEYGK